MRKILLFTKKIILQFAPPVLYKKIVFRGIKKMRFSDPPDEEIELLLLPYLLKKDAVFFDVGANLGTYTFQALKCTKEKNMYAFEPIPASFKKLQKAFKKANLHNLAFTGNPEITSTHFKIPSIKGKVMQTRGSLNVNYTEPEETSSEIIEVSVDTIDNFVQKNNIKAIDFIKIDVEGHEAEVLKGAMETLNKFKPTLQVEIEQRHNTFPISQIFETLNTANYNSYYFNPKSLQFIHITDDPSKLQNLADFKKADYINNFYFFNREDFNLGRLEKICEEINKT